VYSLYKKMKNDNNHIDFVALIGKYLAKEASADEIRSLEKWVEESEENKRLFNQHKQSWILSGINKENKKIDVDAEWDNLNSKLFGPKIESVPPLKIRKSQPGFPVLFRIAAAVVVLFGLSFLLYTFFLKPGSVELVASNEIKTETLTDGSIITLNRNSTVIYPDKFNKDIREVELAGDAYFEVEHNKNQPFVIKSQNIEIEVLGTSFYVNAHEKNPTVEVVVNSGGVALRSDTETQVVLKAGERGVFDKKTGQLIKEKNDDINFNSWKTRKLVFDDTELLEVVEKLNKVYNSNIEIINPGINECRITVTFDSMSLEAVLNILGETLDIFIEKSKDGYSISGEGCIIETGMLI